MAPHSNVRHRRDEACSYATMASSVAALLIGLAAHCALATVPTDLSNFQNEYVCDAHTLVVRPATVQDVQDAVRLHGSVQANGAGRSWNRPFFCAGPAAPENLSQPAVLAQSEPGIMAGRPNSSVNIVTTAIRPLAIRVLEEEEAVVVDAGVITIDLLNYLANYVTARAPTGWTLPAFPWYVYQTVGGAVATGTHGSSLKWGTMSNQVLEMQLVVANGSLVTLTPASHPFLMRAARVAVGKLGIITQLKMRIVREQPVTRRLRTIPASAFLSLMSEAQTSAQRGSYPDWVNETEFFWLPHRSQFMMVSFTRGDDPDPATRQAVLSSYSPQNTTVFNTSRQLLQDSLVTRMEDLPLLQGVSFDTPAGLTPAAQVYTQWLLQQHINAPFTLPRTDNSSSGGSSTTVPRPLLRMPGGPEVASSMNPVAAGLTWQLPTPIPVLSTYGDPVAAAGLLDTNGLGVSVLASNATLEAASAYLKQPASYEFTVRSALFDQYEVAFPLRQAADCLAGLLAVLYGNDTDSLRNETRARDKGFRTPPLIRVVAKEDALLGLTFDEPHMYINIEDYMYYNTGRRSNTAFQAVMAYLRSSPNCGSSGLHGAGARLHWGKAGWPDPGCWHGDKEYGSNWCHFGCALRQLDPGAKFTDSAPDRWNWQGVDLDGCCGPDGFLVNKPNCTCSVQHARDATSCPPAPHYTNR
ncbi:hypothetical protein V8C86DRAFT_2752850 [Haematococcus lacustris]